MSKLFRTIFYPSPYSMGAFESWLSDMAKKGKIFRAMDSGGCTFDEAEPLDLEYRVEISEEPFSVEKIDTYEKCGWTFVTRVRDLVIFSGLSSSNYTEIHTDPKEQSYTLTRLVRKIWMLVLYTAFIIISGFISIGIVINMGGNGPYYNFLKFGVPLLELLGLGLVMIYVIFTRFIDSVLLKRQLQSGKPVSHHANWKKSMRNMYIFFVLAIIICGGTLTVIVINQINGGVSGGSITEQTELPVPRLSDIIDWADVAEYDQYQNYFKKERGLLITKKIDVYESASTNYDDENALYASLDTEYYELAIPFLAEGFMNDLLAYNCSDDFERFPDKRPHVIPYEGLDKVLYMPVLFAGDFVVAAVKGKQVIYVSYHGNENYMTVIDAIAESLK